MVRATLAILLVALAGANAIFDKCSTAFYPSPKEFFTNKQIQIKCMVENGLQEAKNKATGAILSSLNLPDEVYQVAGLDGGFFDDVEDANIGDIVKIFTDTYDTMEKYNLITDSEEVRKCIAEAKGLTKKKWLIFTVFDDEAFQDSIRADVAGTDVAENVEKGIQNCGKVEEYNTEDYMDCIKAYCSTGEAPQEDEE